jgi:cyclic pyranopterin phosphate synthase
MFGVFRFEDIDESLPLLPLSARRALDVAGRRLSLAAWQKMTMEPRSTMVEQGAAATVDVAAVRAAVVGADPPADEMEGADDTLSERPTALEGTVTHERWLELSKLERFALRHLIRRNKPQRLREALAEIAPNRPTHLDERGDARMVDVGQKPITHRRAVARASVQMRPETAQLVVDAGTPKGDVLATARIAGIMAAKRTSDLIPLCHQIPLDKVEVAFEVDAAQGRIEIRATAVAHDRTGVEMEAMTSASVAALTIYDMLKGVERGITIEEVVLLEKQGGRSGHYLRDEET